MPWPKLEVADIFRRHGEAWRAANAGHVSLAQRRVLTAIEACRTPCRPPPRRRRRGGGVAPPPRPGGLARGGGGRAAPAPPLHPRPPPPWPEVPRGGPRRGARGGVGGAVPSPRGEPFGGGRP